MLKQRYAYLAALFIVLLISFQSGIADGRNVIEFQLDPTVFYAINYFFWALILPVLTRMIGNKSWSLNNIPVFLVKGLLVILFHFLITNLLYYLAKLIYDPITVSEFIFMTSNYLLESFFRRFIDLFLIVIVLKALANYTLSLERKEKLEALNRQLHETKFQMLKSQLNPHFLFNALHSVYTMIGFEDERAKKMVLKIGHLLRKMLDDSTQQFIPLSEELNYVSDYLSIEKERFHDRLKVEMDIEEQTKAIEVPRLFLQPLVENAIKHGIASLEEGGTISISTEVAGNDLEVTVKNPVQSSGVTTVSTGIGLANLKERLYTLDNGHSMDVNKTDQEFVVSVKLKGMVA